MQWTNHPIDSIHLGKSDRATAPATGRANRLVSGFAGQILAASTYPDQVVEADRWLQEHTDLKGDQRAQAVDQQDWDPSVKALTEFPLVLANMDKNLSWTSSLGDAYINHQKDVMDAVQDMRNKAKKSGNLKSTSQVNVSQKGQDIVIEPANPEVVYVPEYNPWLVYGPAIAPWPGWYWYPGLYWTAPGIAIGVGFGIGLFAGFGWGWGHWGADWHNRDIRFGHGRYVSHSRAMVDRSYYANRARGGTGFHGGGGFHGGSAFHGGAEHGFSGHGSVYEKDLGPKTANLGPQIKGKPTVGWTLVR